MIDGKTVLVTGGTGSSGMTFVEIAGGTYSPALHTSFHEDEIAHGVLMPWRKLAAEPEDGDDNEGSFEGPTDAPVFRGSNDPYQA